MKWRQVNLTFTQEEHAYLSKLAESKNKKLWPMLQSDLNKILSGIAVQSDTSCSGDKKRINKSCSVPHHIWEPIYCLSQRMGVSPGQLIYAIAIAPHLPQIIKQLNSKDEDVIV